MYGVIFLCVAITIHLPLGAYDCHLAHHFVTTFCQLCFTGTFLQIIMISMTTAATPNVALHSLQKSHYHFVRWKFVACVIAIIHGIMAGYCGTVQPPD